MTTDGPAAHPTDVPSSSPTETATSTPTAPPRRQTPPTTPPTTTTTTVPPTTPTVRVDKASRYYNDVLAEHLDPASRHLEQYTRESTPRRRRASTASCSRSARRTGGRTAAAVRSAAPGRERLGPGRVALRCGPGRLGLPPLHRETSSADPASAEVGTHDGVLQAAVEHASGQVVVIAADPTCVPPAAPPTSRAARPTCSRRPRDDRLILPGDAPVAPPRSTPRRSRRTAGGAGEARRIVRADRISRTPSVRGAWSVGGAERGTVSWSVDPVYSEVRRPA